MLIWIIVVMMWFSGTFWFFEKTAYCELENGNVTVYMKKEKWLSKCQVYLDAINQLSQQKYNDILLIRQYMQWDDTRYRKWVLETKQKEFLKLINYKVQIMSFINEFETVFFEQYKVLLQKEMKLYYSDLEMEYYILINQNTWWNYWGINAIQNRITNLEQQMWTVDHILNAEKLDDVMEVAQNYIYLKKVLEWK